MICLNCGTDSPHIKVTTHGESCHACGGFSQTSGSRVDNTIARNSFRVREQQQHHEGDMIPPHRYNHETRSREPNPEFVKLYADKAHAHYTPEELRAAKMPKLAKQVEARANAKPKKDKSIKFKGSTKKGMKKLGITNGN